MAVTNPAIIIILSSVAEGAVNNSKNSNTPEREKIMFIQILKMIMV